MSKIDNDIQNEKLLALGSMASGIAHDLNNLLTAVLGHVSFLKIAEDPLDSRESVNAIEVGVRRAAKLTQQIVDFARKEEGTDSINVSDLCALLNSSIPLVSPSLPDSITLGLKLQQPVIEVEADESQLTQIVLNLLFNARDAMPSGGKISILIEVVEFLEERLLNGFNLSPARYAKLSVHDQGHGIAPNIQTKIFDPFFTTKRGTGTGIGLATVFFLVKSLRGAIDVSSEVGSGTTFEVYLPIAQQSLKTAPTLANLLAQSEPPKRVLNKVKADALQSATLQAADQGKTRIRDNLETSTKKILVVDDEDGVRLVLQRSLEILGYEVIAAENGLEALKEFKRDPASFALVVMDMIMPNMPGEELFYHLKDVNSDVKVLISSGYASDGKTQQLLRNGAKGFIQKPFAIEELAQEVKAVLKL